jgi:2-polyprenyl-3-methyl-5-hydroxy-6-metoxy-1,4-benzoquinol methylase
MQFPRGGLMNNLMRVSEYFDGVYSQHERFWWQESGRYELNPNKYPYSLLTQLTLRQLAHRPRGRALDLGAGEGTDAIRLALLGYEVDAVEISEIAAKKIHIFAEEAGAKVRVFAKDILDFTPDGLYDVVICNGVLHYVEDKKSVISLMQGATREGGINVVSLWSTYTPVPACHEIVPVYCDPEDGAVTSSYQDWATDLMYFERNKAETSHSDMPDHSHSHLKLIATKPGA